MCEIDIRESKGDGAFGFRERCNEEIGTEGHRGCNSRLQRVSYDQREDDTLGVTFPWTTACSPNTMTLPGAETMKAGIRGLDCLFLPLICVRSISSRMPLTVARPLARSDMSTDGEDGELLSEGVCVCGEVLLELDLECVWCVWRGFPPNDRLVELLVIARRACSRGGGGEPDILWGGKEGGIASTE